MSSCKMEVSGTPTPETDEILVDEENECRNRTDNSNSSHSFKRSLSSTIEPRRSWDRELILAVQRHPMLYDKSCRTSRNREGRRRAWETIAEQLPFSAAECQRRWKNSTDVYRRAAQKLLPGRPGPHNRPECKYARVIAFIDPYIGTARDRLLAGSPEADIADEDDTSVENDFVIESIAGVKKSADKHATITHNKRTLKASKYSVDLSGSLDAGAASLDELNVPLQTEFTEPVWPTPTPKPVTENTLRMAGERPLPPVTDKYNAPRVAEDDSRGSDLRPTMRVVEGDPPRYSVPRVAEDASRDFAGNTSTGSDCDLMSDTYIVPRVAQNTSSGSNSEVMSDLLFAESLGRSLATLTPLQRAYVKMRVQALMFEVQSGGHQMENLGFIDRGNKRSSVYERAPY